MECKIEQMLAELDDEDLVGQVLCYDIYDKDDPTEVEQILSKLRPGGIFLCGMDYEKIHMYREMANKYTKLPVAVVVDNEYGPGGDLKDLPVLPSVMAWSACNDADLIEQAGEVIAKITRLHGVSWTLSPVVDINMNYNNPLVHIRSASDNPEQVIKIMGAYLRGIQKNGYMVATLKHFPGDGVDDRNQHFCTTENSLDMATWRDTYGKVYKEMIRQGAAAVMSGHIALPAYAGEADELGAVPCTLSKPLMTELLKGELDFKGAIISDAMSMIGVASRVDLDKMAVKFIQCGGDMVLFNEPADHGLLLAALQNGTLPRERLLDAVRRILRLKIQARLFESDELIAKEIGESKEELLARFHDIATQIAERSIKVVRDYTNVLPIQPKQGARFLSLEIKDNENINSSFISEELQKRGYEVDVVHQIGHKELEQIMGDYDYILVNWFWRGKHGATMRVGWSHVMIFWRGYVMKHPNIIFTSFGDPYKLYDFPYMKTYINTFSYTEPSQRAFVKALLGEIELRAKNPISFKGFFERETV